ncbi:MAG: hypothetical protein F4040_08285 [Synechococcus sp. SB0670_bin_20]|nr:hypothetical protein [Synechococcus sp. SB0670_bin_20]
MTRASKGSDTWPVVSGPGSPSATFWVRMAEGLRLSQKATAAATSSVTSAAASPAPTTQAAASSATQLLVGFILPSLDL